MTTRRRRRRPNQAGFTLIEVMVSILLAAVATSGVIGLYMAVTRSSSYSRHATEASVLAEDQLERLRTVTPVTGSNAGLLDERGVPCLSSCTGNFIFQRSWTVTPVGSYADLVVTVAWNEDGVARQVVMRSKRKYP